jgi:hypothetical protein
MSPAKHWSEETSGMFSEQRFESTYMKGSVALEGAVVDLHSGTVGMNSAALKIACDRRELEQKSQGKFSEKLRRYLRRRQCCF